MVCGGIGRVTGFRRLRMFQEAVHVLWRILCMHRVQCAVEHIGECPFLLGLEVRETLRDVGEGRRCAPTLAVRWSQIKDQS